MARQIRGDLADMRALEEEKERMNPINPKKQIGTRKGYTGIIRDGMTGGAMTHMVGAGATPSMGLSQFRGGKATATKVGKKALALHKAEHEALGMGKHLGEHIQSLHGAGFFEEFAKGLMSVSGGAKRKYTKTSMMGAGKMKEESESEEEVTEEEMEGCGTKKGMTRKTARKAFEMKGGMDTGAYQGEGKGKKYTDYSKAKYPYQQTATMTHPLETTKKIEQAKKEKEVAEAMVELSKGKKVKGEGKVKKEVSANDGRRKRAEIVRKVMKDRGVSLVEASKIVKAEGLYTK